MVISTMEKNRRDKGDRVCWKWMVKFYRLLGTAPKEVKEQALWIPGRKVSK